MQPARISDAYTPCDSVTPKAKDEAAASLQPFVSTTDETSHTQHIMLHVSGMHCARCIWAIESALQKCPEVVSARVNLSTQRLHLSWRGEASLIDSYAELISNLGYHVKPLSQTKESPLSEDKFLLRCAAVSGFAMGNIMLLSVALWSSNSDVMGIATRDLLHWLSAMIALPTLAYSGRPFFRSALKVLSSGHTNMDVPISLALVLATFMSLLETARSAEHAYFDSAIMLLFFLLIGRWLDARARGKARQNASELLEMMQGSASLIEGTNLRQVAICDLRAGDRIRVAAGDKIPTDAIILSGNSELDSSLVTGETLPRAVSVGDTVYGGTINLSAPLTCEVARASDRSLLAEIIRLMEQAEQGRARYVRLADKAARLYTPVVHTLAALAFAGWYGFGGMELRDAMMIAVTTLIITCPCALALAVPVVQVLSVGQLMKRGILVKSGDALERLTEIDTVIFDKTGTLTLGKPRLIGEYPPQVLQLAASLAAYSKHPYSRALCDAYGSGVLLKLEDVSETAGVGLSAIYQGQQLNLGRSEEGVALRRNSDVLAYFTFSDTLRSDAAETIQLFVQSGIVCEMLSGDTKAAASAIAAQLSLTRVMAGLKPTEKLVHIRTLQEKGARVLMVGDGLNDAPSLAEAHISLSPASGMDITQNTADIVFQSESLASVWFCWQIARASTQLVKQNFALAVTYNAIAIPLAVAGYVTPLVAAIAMSSSSLIVIANSFRIHHFARKL